MSNRESRIYFKILNMKDRAGANTFCSDERDRRRKECRLTQSTMSGLCRRIVQSTTGAEHKAKLSGANSRPIPRISFFRKIGQRMTDTPF